MRRVLRKLLKNTIITLYNESEEDNLSNEKTLKSDIIFKNLFSAKRKRELLIDLLESVLEMKIDTIEVQKEVETDISNINEKLGRMDIVVTNKLDTKLEEWLALIDYEKKGLIEMAINQNGKVKRAKEECEYLQGDEAAQRLEELRNRAIRDEKAAFSCGMRQGEAKGEERGEARGISIGEALGKARGITIGEKRGKKARNNGNSKTDAEK